MKTAVSLPDELFERADRFARRAGKSRSELFQDALREYLARRAPEDLTEAVNRAVAAAGKRGEEFVTAASQRVLERVEW
ncbi:ribbon-helix-helix protein, CopG family [Candidatus Bipolaricaulota bacterium]|nr:ribbon-helix-helix protein, CopG family [Candidatus Bipolaricaulota bacterium]